MTTLKKLPKDVSKYLTATRMHDYVVTIRQQGQLVTTETEVVTIHRKAESKEQLGAMLALQAMAYGLTKMEILSITCGDDN